MKRLGLLLAVLFSVSLATGCQWFSSPAEAGAGADAGDPDTAFDIDNGPDGMPPTAAVE